MQLKNIFNGVPKILKEELLEDILASKNFRLERIVSEGHSSPEGFWYDQYENEFVLLLSGNAVLEFQNEASINLKPGDYIIIPSHKKHRVKETSSKERTFWLALHFK